MTHIADKPLTRYPSDPRLSGAALGLTASQAGCSGAVQGLAAVDRLNARRWALDAAVRSLPGRYDATAATTAADVVSRATVLYAFLLGEAGKS